MFTLQIVKIQKQSKNKLNETHQKSPIEVQIHILVHTNKEKQESQTYRKGKEIPPPHSKREKEDIADKTMFLL